MAGATSPPSARESELLEAAYTYVLEHGLTALSLRPLSAAIGTSPRVLLYLFGSKDGLVRALLERARTDELALLRSLDAGRSSGLTAAARSVWDWLAAEDHRPLLRLWVEVYARSLVEPDGPWAGFAHATVTDWLALLEDRRTGDEDGSVDSTLVLAVLRGALLDLLATADRNRVTTAVHRQLALMDGR
jgi:AcrR family transcriptional regulator